MRHIYHYPHRFERGQRYEEYRLLISYWNFFLGYDSTIMVATPEIVQYLYFYDYIRESISPYYYIPQHEITFKGLWAVHTSTTYYTYAHT